MSEANNTPQDTNRSTLTDGAGNVISTPAGEENTSMEKGAPLVVGDQTFASQEEMSAWWDRTHGGADTITAGATTDAGSTTQDGAAGNDSIKGGDGNDSVPGTTRTDDEIRASLKEAGGIFADPKYEPYALEFEKTGALSPESVTKAAADYGVSEDFVKEFIAGQEAKRAIASDPRPTAQDTAMASALVAVAPDEKTYNDILEWGRENLTPAERKAYNGALDRKDADTAAALLSGFKQRWTAAGNGDGPRDVTEEGAAHGGGGSQVRAAPFSSAAEQTKAIQDPKYDTDPNYRAEVAARIAVSNF